MLSSLVTRSFLALAAVVPFAACGGATSHTTADAGSDERCSLPAEPGNCLAYAPAYYHDTRTGLCTPFVYGGCGGNENRFPSQGDCEAACAGGTPDFGSCSVPTDCMLASPGCCAACDPVDLTAFVALNREHAAEYQAAIGCGVVSCGPCQDVPVEQRTRGYFTATCQKGRCIVLDVRTTPATQCKSSVGCHLRDGSQCCERCSPNDDFIAISSEDELGRYVCDPTPLGCPPCVPQIPSGLAAVCQDGQCRVTGAP